MDPMRFFPLQIVVSYTYSKTQNYDDSRLVLPARHTCGQIGIGVLDKDANSYKIQILIYGMAKNHGGVSVGGFYNGE
jgi:hypothetical protein